MRDEDKPYEMPSVDIGQTVYWYRNGIRDENPIAAIVTHVTSRNVALAAFPKDYINHEAHDGVMHVDNPRARQYHAGSGAWDYTERDKQAMQDPKGSAKAQSQTQTQEKKKVA